MPLRHVVPVVGVHASGVACLCVCVCCLPFMLLPLLLRCWSVLLSILLFGNI